MSTTINKEEIQKFSKLAEQWWDVNGKFKPLHMFNPVRIEYITDSIKRYYKIQNKKSTIISPDSKIEILSVNSYEKKTYKKINTYLVDEDIIVVEKPANMITHRASKNNDVSLCEHIVNSYPEIKSEIGRESCRERV